jgi:hypothetical protein
MASLMRDAVLQSLASALARLANLLTRAVHALQLGNLGERVFGDNPLPVNGVDEVA